MKFSCPLHHTPLDTKVIVVGVKYQEYTLHKKMSVAMRVVQVEDEGGGIQDTTLIRVPCREGLGWWQKLSPVTPHSQWSVTGEILFHLIFLMISTLNTHPSTPG